VCEIITQSMDRLINGSAWWCFCLATCNVILLQCKVWICFLLHCLACLITNHWYDLLRFMYSCWFSATFVWVIAYLIFWSSNCIGIWKFHGPAFSTSNVAYSYSCWLPLFQFHVMGLFKALSYMCSRLLTCDCSDFGPVVLLIDLSNCPPVPLGLVCSLFR
jgi:hypothetical protein